MWSTELCEISHESVQLTGRPLKHWRERSAREILGGQFGKDEALVNFAGGQFGEYPEEY